MFDISVVIPSHDSAEYVTDAINSVLVQTHRPFEIIVVDDGSTDGTREALTAYGDSVRYIRQERKGPAAARNHGVKLARGEFITFLDADDLLLPDCLLISMRVAQNYPALGAVFHNSIRAFMGRSWDANGRGHWEASGTWATLQQHAALAATSIPEVWIAKAAYFRLLLTNFPFMNGTTIRREMFLELGGFDERLDMGEDHDLWLRLASRSNIFLCKRPHAVWRRRPQSLTHRREPYLRSRITVPRSNYVPGLLSTRQRSEFLLSQRIHYAEYGQFLLDSNRLQECRRLMRQCSEMCGSNANTLKILLLSNFGILPLELLRRIKEKSFGWFDCLLRKHGSESQ